MMILSGSFSFIDFLVNTVLPINQSTSFPEPNIPLFHYSNIPIGAKPLSSDFRQFFGGTPPGLAGVVVLTDTDQTNEGVIAYYSSVILMSK
jgi:hypothetical protein